LIIALKLQKKYPTKFQDRTLNSQIEDKNISGSTEVKVVFVHLRTLVPKYVWRNMERIKSQNPRLEVTLLSDREENLNRAKQLGVNAWEYIPSDAVLKVFDCHSLSSGFRNGFWQTSILRLFAFLDYVEEVDCPMVHLESDVLTSASFPWAKFETLEHCAWLQFNDQRDVAAIVYCPNGSEAGWLKDALLETMSTESQATDMTLLSAVSKEFRTRITLLPIAQKKDSSLYAQNVNEETRVRNSSAFSLFGGIFDGAPLGMWLMGQDPRNHYGILQRHIHLSDSYIDPRQLRVGSQKSTVFIYDGAETFQLFNLHLHSKIDMDFGQFSSARIRMGVFLNLFHFPLYSFAPLKLAAVFQEVYSRLDHNPLRLIRFIFSKLIKRN
jgi:hypothetical protein